MTLTKISILEYALREGGGGHSKAYSMYAFINVDNCERPLSEFMISDNLIVRGRSCSCVVVHLLDRPERARDRNKERAVVVLSLSMQFLHKFHH